MIDQQLQPPLEPDSEPSELTDTVVRGTGLASAGYILAQVLTLGFYFALARLASPEDFGVLAAGTVLVSIGLLFSESGMLAALIHRPDRIEEAASTATISTMVGGLGLGLLALAASPAIGALFHDDTVREVAAATSGLLLLRSLRVVPEALLQRRFSFLRRLVIEPVGVVAFGVTAVIATANGMGVWGLVLGYYASELVDVVLSWALVGWRPRFRIASFAMWRELIAYGRHIIATAAIERVEQQVPVVLLGRFVGTNPLGQFRFASRMESTLGSVMVQSASYVLFPAMARITSDRARFREACIRSLRSMCTIGFPLGMTLVPLGVPAALVFFGPDYKDAGYGAMALSGATVAGIPISFASEVLKADGRPDILARVRAVAAISTTVFMIALLPFDLVGICAGFSLGTFAGAAYALVRVSDQLEVGLGRMLRQILPAAAASIFMAAAVLPVEFLVIDAGSYGLTAAGVGLLALEGVLAIALYVLALRVISPASFHEFVSLARRLRRRGGPSEPEDGDPPGGDAASGGSDNPTEASVP